MKEIKVLIVENEVIVAKDIKKTVEELGFKVINTAYNINQALETLKNDTPDIILMDIYLNDKIDGIELVKKIYKTKYIPVIYLTGFDDDNTIIRAVETNPVGYLLKPFNRGELKSTILLALHKSKKIEKRYTNPNHINIGYDYYLDMENVQAFFQDQLIKLSKKELELLILLFQSEGKVVSFETIEYTLWENVSVTNNAIRTLVYRLRIKLHPKLIESVPYIGFRLNLDHKD